MSLHIRVRSLNQASYGVSPELFPYHIGRAPANDLCIDDATVSQRHAQVIRTDAGYAIVDAGSTNGIICGGLKSAHVDIRDALEVNLGTTVLEFHLEGPPGERTRTLSPTKIRELMGAPPRLAGSAPLVAGLLVLAGVGRLAELVRPAPFDASKYAATLLAVALGLVGATLLLSLFCRLHSRSYRFGALLTAHVYWCAAYWLGLIALPYLIFNQPLAAVQRHGMPAFAYAVLPCYFATIARIIFEDTAWRRLLKASLFVAAGILALAVVLNVLFAQLSHVTTLSQRLVYPLWEVPPYALSAGELSDEIEKLAAEIREDVLGRGRYGERAGE